MSEDPEAADRGADAKRAGHSSSSAPPAAVERWELSGGAIRVARVGDRGAVVELLRCDGGEVVELLELHDPREVRWARDRLAADGRRRD
ncbi:hypothetical protein [Leucobacter triazinivorans]|uniref:Uncharacterized protein n=1 Tax=Leucobacter triazinivorans TaxID=1784719 RepID=A0A4P6KE51_9MICO|nr:hypothetical protein [Leucobacter triazinivorans]QBE48188.1 hypothetical protein EVS81_04530 [Leucobacter triazinivorans]